MLCGREMQAQEEDSQLAAQVEAVALSSLPASAAAPARPPADVSQALLQSAAHAAARRNHNDHSGDHLVVEVRTYRDRCSCCFLK